MACHLLGAKSLPESIMTYWLHPWEQTSVKFESNTNVFIQHNAFENVIAEFWPFRWIIDVFAPRTGDVIKCIHVNLITLKAIQ